jgi:UDP-N-acetylmuramyl tripeptide synthase
VSGRAHGDRGAPRGGVRRPTPREALLSAELWLARAVGALARRAGRGGTSLPGKVLVRLDPAAIPRLAARLERGTVIVSATNGKTTTATMAAAVLERAGVTLVHNSAGANMAGGVASALLQAARGRAAIAGQLGLFEVDEFWLDRLAPALGPRALVLGNLFRDQLDRYGELETIAERWAGAVRAVGPGCALVLNADDPLVADLGRGVVGARYFGVEDPAIAQPEMQHASDSKHCRRCGAAYLYEAIYLGHLGRYLCPACGARRPSPSIAAAAVRLDGTRGVRFQLRTPAGDAHVRLPLPGLYNVYNALAASALCLDLGIALEHVVAGLQAVAPAFGRAEIVRLDGVEVQVLLVKNPAGANEILRTLALEPGRLELLGALNDRTADGRDVSWIWDADFELLAGRVRHVTCAGTRAAELALRFKYAGVPVDRITVHARLAEALDAAAARCAPTPAAGGEERRLFVLPTYTALLELQAELAARGRGTRFWERP